MKPKRSTRRGVTQGDIARAAGVSRSMVTMILSGTDEASTATRERVLSAARELRYRPNLLVHGIRTGKSLAVGVVIPPLPFFGHVIHGIHDGLFEHGCLPLLHYRAAPDGPATNEEELNVIHQLLDRRVDGVILLANDESVDDLYFREVWERGIPLLAIDRPLGNTHADFVGTDDTEGGRQAAEHLLNLGHRHFGQLGGSKRIGTFAGRRIGFEAALNEAGATCHTVEVQSEDDCGPAAVELLAASPRPTAIFAHRDYAVPHLYAEARRLGLRIPEDLSIVGYSDFEVAWAMSPPLTTIRQDPIAIGRNAAQIMVGRIEKTIRGNKPVSLRLMPKL
ncbi:MAG: LacI family DNA-binding transcriptional regulator, partial [Tepidisphaeraceae bacterium]